MITLTEILTAKAAEVTQQERELPRSKLPERKLAVRDFYEALDGDGLQIIAEIKRKSPSRGSIRPNLDPVKTAVAYEAAGAAAISVLTDKTWFGGDIAFLAAVREAVSIPVLQKDFIIQEYQVYEAFSFGADAILLIADALPAKQLVALYRTARSLGLHVLVEAHSRGSLIKLRQVNPVIAGVNSRDLRSMKTDLEIAVRGIGDLPDYALKVAQSGIKKVADLKRIVQAGFDAALIGTALVKSGDPGANLAKLLTGLAKAKK